MVGAFLTGYFCRRMLAYWLKLFAGLTKNGGWLNCPCKGLHKGWRWGGCWPQVAVQQLAERNMQQGHQRMPLRLFLPDTCLSFVTGGEEAGVPSCVQGGGGSEWAAGSSIPLCLILPGSLLLCSQCTPLQVGAQLLVLYVKKKGKGKASCCLS